MVKTSFFPPPAIIEIADLFDAADERARIDLMNGRVVGERDYMSRLITFLEYPSSLGIKISKFKSIFFSNSFPGALEQKFGCDCYFVFRYNGHLKMLAIEAKYPRFHNVTDSWDYKKLTAHESHFSSQIYRQERLMQNGIAVLEMFINNNLPVHRFGGFYRYGSSLVEHQIAKRYKQYRLRPSTRKWSKNDIINIVNDQSRRTTHLNIGFFVKELLFCHIGSLYNAKGSDSIAVLQNLKNGVLPLPNEYDYVKYGSENNTSLGNQETFINRAIEFMKEVGLRHLGYIDIF